MALAGLVCAAFQDVTGFSLWHILKIQASPKDKRVDDEHFDTEIGLPGIDDTSNPLGTYAELGCRVCYA
jgi:hypothetical protein